MMTTRPPAPAPEAGVTKVRGRRPLRFNELPLPSGDRDRRVVR